MDSILIFALITFPTGIIINFMRLHIARACAIWFEALAVLYSLYTIYQLAECVSKGVLSEYRIKTWYAVGFVAVCVLML